VQQAKYVLKTNLAYRTRNIHTTACNGFLAQAKVVPTAPLYELSIPLFDAQAARAYSATFGSPDHSTLLSLSHVKGHQDNSIDPIELPFQIATNYSG
jgi:hypothetical protein